MPRRPHTEQQMKKLWAEASERSWYADQIYGRATEINPHVEDDGLSVMSVAEMSTHIDAVISEAPWVDPRQRRLPL